MRHHAFAAATGLVTAALFIAPGSQSQAASADPTGYWMKPDAERESKIQVFKCGKGKTQLCAKIAWLKDPKDSKGRPLHDIRNENTSMRDRPIVGLTIFTGLTPSAPSTWTGKIYNPEDGHTYTATLTVLSRKEIKLRGCKAWLLCGEKQWLRTSAPREELPAAAPAEGTQQIEASLTPSSPPAAEAPANAESVESVAAAQPAAANVETAAVAAPAAPPEELQAMAAPQAPDEPQAVEASPSPALVTEVAASAPPADYNWRKGYGFLNVSAGPDTAARLSGENVSSMFAISEPIAADSVATTSSEPGEAVPLPQPKPKAKAKPILATAAAKPAPKAETSGTPAEQGAPAPQNSDETQADGANASQAETAEASMVEEPPLTRRQKRMLRRQQHQADPFLPWLR